MKKEETFKYISPSVKVVNVAVQSSILSGSITGEAKEPEEGYED